jgi:lysophospholipase L1-like esterase
MVRFVALGDSITVGLGDAVPDRARLGVSTAVAGSSHEWRGWATLLAEAFGPAVEYHNLAELGAQSHTLAARQLPVALALRPTVAAVVVGVNDTLRGSFHIGRTGAALSRTIRELRAVDAHVLTCSLPDPGRMLRLPKALARQLARRIRAVNAVTAELAVLHDTVHFDACVLDQLYERRMWSVDRLHPSEAGHRLLARSFADLLAHRGVAVAQPPSLVPTSPPPTRAASVKWMATKGTKWVKDRSTDLVPTLLALCAKEWWYTTVGRVNVLDELLAVQVARTLKALREEDDPVWT